MNVKYLIETSAWVLYFGGGKGADAVQRLIDQGQILTSVVAIAEIADKCEREGRGLAPILRFLQKRTAILPLTLTVAIRAAKLKQQLRKHHGKISLADALQLATAYEANAVLVTTDNDFRGVDEVMMIA